MENKDKLEILNNQKKSVNHDLVTLQYEVDFLLSLAETENIPDFAQGDLEHNQTLIILFQKKLDWYDLKIEELTAIIENTN
jgi:hypothetical protein